MRKQIMEVRMWLKKLFSKAQCHVTVKRHPVKVTKPDPDFIYHNMLDFSHIKLKDIELMCLTPVCSNGQRFVIASTTSVTVPWIAKDAHKGAFKIGALISSQTEYTKNEFEYLWMLATQDVNKID